MGGAQDTYIRYESAGDMYVGRVCSRLPLDKPEFDVVGPCFSLATDMEFIMQTVKNTFRGIPDNLVAIGEKCLASIVYHHEYLDQNLPGNHPLKQTLLFRGGPLLNRLKACVKCSLKGDEMEMKWIAIQLVFRLIFLCFDQCQICP